MTASKGAITGFKGSRRDMEYSSKEETTRIKPVLTMAG